MDANEKKGRSSDRERSERKREINEVTSVKLLCCSPCPSWRLALPQNAQSNLRMSVVSKNRYKRTDFELS